MNTKHCSQNLKYHSTDKSVLIHPVLRAHSPDAARTQYLTHTPLCSSIFILSSNIHCFAATTHSVAREHNNPSLTARALAVR